MKSTILLQSASKNQYLFDKEQKVLLYCPAPLYDILSNNPNTPIGNETESKSNDLFDNSYEYYYKKSLLLKENGFFTEESENTIGLINEELVRKQIANLIQLTFEVTDACNLKCKYCGYGEFYGNHDQRENTMLPVSYAKRIINHLIPYWESNEDLSYIHTVNLGFYGGEPLINFEFIKDVVTYTKELKLTHVRFDYSMTTNGLLLKKHAAFLSENNFEILVSLDGNEFNNSYRVDHRNKTVFNNIIDNVKWVQMHYPDYFSDKVNFNAVLHNRNSVSEINSFFQNEFGKTPSIGELNTVGIRSDKTKEFYSMYKNKVESLHQSENYTDIENHFFLGMPDPKNLFVFLNQYSDNVYKSYNNFFSNQQSFKLPTGTCLPFGKKMFITATGKILPCERIGHQFALGKIHTDFIELDINQIANKYNEYYSKIQNQCRKCYNINGCVQCIFYLNDLDKMTVCNCDGYSSYKGFTKYVHGLISYVENNPHIYHRITNEVPPL